MEAGAEVAKREWMEAEAVDLENLVAEAVDFEILEAEVEAVKICRFQTLVIAEWDEENDSLDYGLFTRIIPLR